MSKYHSKYGYVRQGKGISDVFNWFSRLPPSVLDAGKKAATSIATQGITAAGDRIGSALANKLAPKKTIKAPKKDIRKNILKDLKLTDVVPDQYGFGRTKKIRGKGIKILQ